MRENKLNLREKLALSGSKRRTQKYPVLYVLDGRDHFFPLQQWWIGFLKMEIRLFWRFNTNTQQWSTFLDDVRRY